MEQLEKSEEEFNSGMNKLLMSTEDISSCIQQTVGILAHLINKQQTPYQQQNCPPLSPPSFNLQSVLQYGHPSQRNVQNEIRGTKKTREFMKRTRIVLISASSDIYISFYFTRYLSC